MHTFKRLFFPCIVLFLLVNSCRDITLVEYDEDQNNHISQNNSISGYIYYNNKPLTFATINLDDSLKYKVYSNDSGFFKINYVSKGIHNLSVELILSNENYTRYASQLNILDSAFVDTIKLINPPLIDLPEIISDDLINLTINFHNSFCTNQNTCFRLTDPNDIVTNGEYLFTIENISDTTITKSLFDTSGYFYQIITQNDSGYTAVSNIPSSYALDLRIGNMYYKCVSYLMSGYSFYETISSDKIVNTIRYFNYDNKWLRSTRDKVYEYTNSGEKVYLNLFWAVGDTVRNNYIVTKNGIGDKFDNQRRFIKLRSISGTRRDYYQIFGETYYSYWDGIAYYYNEWLNGVKIGGQIFGSFP